MSTEISFPASFSALEESSLNLQRPGQQITRMDTGGTISRTWTRRNYSVYNIRPIISRLTEDELDNLVALLHNIEMSGSHVWVTEPISRRHSLLRAGAASDPDGSRTTFPVPIFSGSGLEYFWSGIPVGATYTGSAANLLTDNQASAETDTTGVTVYGTATLSRVTTVSREGLASFKVDPTGTQTDVGVEIPYTSGPTITAGREYTFGACVRGIGDFEILVQYYNGATPLGSLTSQATSGVSGPDWTELTAYTKTAEAGADGVRFIVNRSDSRDTSFNVDCLYIAPGDLDRYWLPSQSPPVVNWSSAPSSGAVIEASGEGYKMARCRLTNFRGWTYSGPNLIPGSLTLEEEPWL